MSAQLEDVAGAMKALVAKSRVDPVWFAQNVLRVALDPWQEDLLNAVGDVVRKREGLPTVINSDGLNQISVVAMQGPGKTQAAAYAMHWFGFCFKGLSPCTAPKEKQLHTRLWPRVRAAMKNAIPGYNAFVNADQVSRITFCGDKDWGFVAETGRTPENLAGYHDDYMLIVVDEASGVPEEMFPVLEGAISTGKIVILLLLGNPTQNEGTFYESHCRPSVAKHYFRLQVTLDRAPRVQRDWVARMEAKYGKNSPVVQVRCYGRFAEVGKNQLIVLSWLTRAYDRDPAPDGTFPNLVVGIDVADGGDDETVITVGKRYGSFTHLLRQAAHSFEAGVAPIESADAAERMFIEYGGVKERDWFVVDAVGVGAGTAGTLMKRGYKVVRFKGGATEGVNSVEYRNLRVQSYLAMRNDLRDGFVSIAEDFADEGEREEFEAQLCGIRTKLGNERLEDLESKQDMRRRGVKSPDRADSTSMLWATEIPDVHGGQGSATEAFGQSEVANEPW